jgi:hypothetical protein
MRAVASEWCRAVSRERTKAARRAKSEEEEGEEGGVSMTWQKITMKGMKGL